MNSSNLKRSTVTNISCDNGLVYVQPNGKFLQVRRIRDVSKVHQFPLESCGSSGALVLKNEIYFCSGRSNFEIDSPDGSDYTPTKYLYIFRLPCECRR